MRKEAPSAKRHFTREDHKNIFFPARLEERERERERERKKEREREKEKEIEIERERVTVSKMPLTRLNLLLV